MPEAWWSRPGPWSTPTEEWRVVGGVFSTPANEIVLFCVGVRQTGWKEPHWRGLQQSWLLDLIDGAGGARPAIVWR